MLYKQNLQVSKILCLYHEKSIPYCLKDAKGFISKTNRSENIKIFLVGPNYIGIKAVIERLNKARKQNEQRSASFPPSFNFSKGQKLLCWQEKFIHFSKLMMNYPICAALTDILFCAIIRLLIVCYYHVTYEFQKESTPICLNFKELLARSRRHIWSLSDCNGIRTNNHLVRKRTLNLNGWVFVYELSGCWFESRCSHLDY